MAELKNIMKDSCYANIIIRDSEIDLAKKCLEFDSVTMTSDLSVSVIISTHNRTDILPRTLYSIMQQTYKCAEIIVVDDSDNDDTEKLIKALNSKKITFYKERQNYGGGVSKKTGYLHANGDIIIFSDDDDYFIDDEYFEKIIKKFEDEKYNIIISNTITLYEKESLFELNKVNFSDGISTKEYFNGFQYKYTKPTSMFPLALRKSALDKIDYEKLKFFGDTSLYLYSLFTEGVVGLIDDYIGVYRVQSESVTAKSRADFIVNNFESKKDIYKIGISKNYYTINPEKWLYIQLMTNVSFHFDSKVNPLKEDNKILRWCISNLTGKYRIYICLKICFYNLRNRIKKGIM